LILIYSHKLTNRLKYTFKTIFTDVLQVEVTFTEDSEEFKKSELPKINYSNSKFDTELFFHSTNIIFENGINEQNISVFEHKNNKCFFTAGKDSELPFDVFAASFYLITRYEEYLPHIRDSYDRYTVSESLAFQNNFLEIPLVNIWANEIKDILKEKYPGLKFPNKNFEFISTIDIDNAFAYKHKGIMRIVGGLIKSIIKTKDFKKRINVLFNKKDDPYDTFNYQFEVHKKYNIKPIYFFLLGDYAKNDKNIPVRNKKFQSLIKSISDYYKIGIHPSYSSNSDATILTKEIGRLKTITHKNVVKSRQHFLKLNLPGTYRNLINNDIKFDYTMGYAEKNGFRASICSPYCFYDLDTESESNLTIIPFTIMEATFKYYENASPEEVTRKISELMNTVESVNGTFVSVWHNESLSDEGIWKGWKIIYEKMLKESLSKI
jgi:Family of unknown function (DUF7033)